MKITDSNIMMQSAHRAETRDVSQESLTVWRRDEVPETVSQEGRVVGLGGLRQRALSLLQQPQGQSIEPPQVERPTAVSNDEEPLDNLHELEVSLLKLLVERMTGRAIQVVSPADLKRCEGEVGATQAQQAAEIPDGGEGWGMVYEHYQSHYESEQTSFQVEGVVNTADGQEMRLQIQLSMSREFFTETSMIQRAGEALKDPLVVNFDGQAAELTRQRYQFDIDADGNREQIHFVTPESGFLALDRNGDGEINDGSELFGTRSGNGFADLSVYDSDDNGWIDENDPMFERLRVWLKDEQGRDQLVALGAKGIGAIYLGHITTPFEIKNPENRLLGVVRESGFYLEETGEAGTLQQVDLVV
jgi:hypothetical protein